MDTKIISKERTLGLIDTIIKDSEFQNKNKNATDLIFNLEKIIHGRKFFKNYMNDVRKNIESLDNTDLKLVYLENEFTIYIESIQKKYLNKEESKDFILYEYDNFYSVFLKNKHIDISFILKKILKDDNFIKSIWIDDKKCKNKIIDDKMKVSDITTLLSKEKGKKIVIYIEK